MADKAARKSMITSTKNTLLKHVKEEFIPTVFEQLDNFLNDFESGNISNSFETGDQTTILYNFDWQLSKIKYNIISTPGLKLDQNVVLRNSLQKKVDVLMNEIKLLSLDQQKDVKEEICGKLSNDS